MKFLIDTSTKRLPKLLESPLVLGQLLTPLTRFTNANLGPFAIDNGAFAGLDVKAFRALLEREESNKDRCLFVVVPDVVGDARRTLEIFDRREMFVRGWPLAFVAQDGQENLPIPWDSFNALFLGGGDPWKDSKPAQAIVKTAKILGKHVHIGRVNDARRYRLFAKLGADTCDGSGVARFPKDRLAVLERKLNDKGATLYEGMDVEHENQDDLRDTASEVSTDENTD